MRALLTEPWFEAAFICDAKAGIHHDDGSPIAFAESQGLRLWCPCGYLALDEHGQLKYPRDLSLNKGRPHAVLIVFSNPPCGILPPADFGPTNKDGSRHPLWQVSGTGLADLTLSPSVDVGNPSCWHGWVKGGVIDPDFSVEAQNIIDRAARDLRAGGGGAII